MKPLKRFSALLMLIWIGCSSVLEAKSLPMTVRIRDGRIQEYVNGSFRRSYGSGMIDASTDGKIVVGVTKDNRIAEYRDGSFRRSYGSGVLRVRVIDGVVYGDLKNGRTAEFVNGSMRRTF